MSSFVGADNRPDDRQMRRSVQDADFNARAQGVRPKAAYRRLEQKAGGIRFSSNQVAPTLPSASGVYAFCLLARCVLPPSGMESFHSYFVY